MVDKAELKTEYDRGYVDAIHGSPRNAPRQAGALNAFLAGLLGTKSSIELQAAYEQGYSAGLATRRSPEVLAELRNGIA